MINDAGDDQWSDDSDFEAPSTSKKPQVANQIRTESEVKSCFKVGYKFDSYEDVQNQLKEYQDKVCSVFYIRDGMTIAQAHKKGILRPVDEKLKYYTLKYCCIHGGKKFKSLGGGARKSSTFQDNCNAFIRLTASKDGKSLEVTALDENHNHICSKKLYQHLPQVRSLSADEKAKVAELLALGANKKKVKEKISTETDKMVLLKDLSNIMACQGSANNLQATIEKLRKKYGADCDVYEEENLFKGLFFVTENMKKSFKFFPEFVGIDATFKLLNIRAPIYLVIAEDSEGNTEIVAVCILVSEDAASINWFLDCFKKAHPTWTKIKTVMADKDLLERRVVKQHFPTAKVLICIFHSLRTFNREITCDKLNITQGQRDSAKELFQKMLYAPTEEHYMKLYDECKSLPTSVMKYFNANWHPIRDEWSMCSDFMQNSFLNTTNNRIESLNAKIKSVVERYRTLEEFVERFFVLLFCLESERDHKAAYAYQKKLVLAFDKKSPEHFYSKLLTRYAFNFVATELSKSDRGKFMMVRKNDTFEFQFADLRIRTTPQSCDCDHYVSMNLPCRHIFIARGCLEMSLCDASICAERWTQNYYIKAQRVFENDKTEENKENGQIFGKQHSETEDVPNLSLTSGVPKYRVLSQQDRYRKAYPIATSLASLASEVTGKHYLTRLQQMISLKRAWADHRNVEISTVDPEQQAFLAPFVTSTPISSQVPSENSVQILKQTLEEVGQKRKSEEVREHDVEKRVEQRVQPRTLESEGGVSQKPFTSTSIDFSKIIVPPAHKMRGRPKGCDKTVIGLPKTRKTTARTEDVPFIKNREKAIVILKWLVEEEVALAAVAGCVIEESFVEVRPDYIPHSILDDDVDVTIVKKYFSADAWQLVEEVVAMKKKNAVFLCGGCVHNLDDTVDEESMNLSKDNKIAIRCDYCLIWYHLPCVSLKKAPKARIWRCPKC